MPAPLTGEVLPAAPGRVMPKDQLVPADIVAEEMYYGGAIVVDAIRTLDATWVAVHTSYGIAGRSSTVRETKASLDRVFPLGYFGEPYDAKSIASQIGNPDIERAVKLSGTISDAETALAGLWSTFEGGDESDGFFTGERLKALVEARRDAGYAGSVAELNARIKELPGGIVLGVNIDRAAMAARLEGVYVGENREGDRSVLPAVSGRDGQTYKLSQAKGVGVFGVFMAASPTGVKRAEARQRARQAEIDSE